MACTGSRRQRRFVAVVALIVAAAVSFAVASCSGGSDRASHQIAVGSEGNVEPELTPNAVGLELPDVEDMSSPDDGSAPLAFTLSAPKLEPTPTPTPRPTPTTATPAPDPASQITSSSATSTTNSTGSGAATAPNPATTTESGDISATAPDPTATATVGASPEPDPGLDGDGDGDGDGDEVVLHATGVGPHRWGAEIEAVSAYIVAWLGEQPTVVDAEQSTTGYRHLDWSGVIIEADEEGALIRWYWYPSLASGVRVRELGDYQGGLRFDRRPEGTQVQTVGVEPNLWWVGSTVSLRYAWDFVDPAPVNIADVVGATIYVTAGPEPQISTGEAITVESGTEVLMSPNGPRLYALGEATSLVVYRRHQQDDQTWALVAPATGNVVAGWIVVPAVETP